METRRFTMLENVVVDFPLGDELDATISSMNAFRAYVRDNAPDALEPFEIELLRTFLKLLSAGTSKVRLGNLAEGEDVLERACTGYVLHVLGWREDEEDITLEIDRADALRASLFPAFYRMRVLRDVMGAEAGIPFLKDYIDTRIHALTTPDESIEDVDRYWEEIADPDFQSPTSGIAARFHRGKNAFRIDRCLWADIMRPLGDPEIAFLVCCYGDTAGVEAMSPHLAYTCPMTLIEGDPFCDKCLHDKRFVEAIEHPARVFYEELGLST